MEKLNDKKYEKTTNMIKFHLLRLITLFCPLRITLDGMDNTATINKPFRKLLYHLGIEKNNHIICFRIGKDEGYNSRYAFEILREGMKPEETVTSELKYNMYYDCFGFEMLCPTVQSIFYNWRINHNSIHETICLPRLTPDRHIYFEILR